MVRSVASEFVGQGSQMSVGVSPRRPLRSRRNRVVAVLRLFALLIWLISAGCASITNPVANGIPVQRLPPELLAESKANMEGLPLTSLRQPPPDSYRLEAEDVLGVWIDGIFGAKGQIPPVTSSVDSKLPPAVGIPVPVRANGTIQLPYVDPIKVAGKTLEETETLIRKAFTEEKEIVAPGKIRIYVSLQQSRKYHILVIRQDSGLNSTTAGTAAGVSASSTGFVISPGASSPGSIQSGRGFAINLPAYENDVLNALAVTGGFPGTDAANEIIIERGGLKQNLDIADKMNKLESSRKSYDSGTGTILRIPLRYQKGEKPRFKPEDIILHTGDVVYIPSGQNDIYYTGGLLPSRFFYLPRDSDLDVVEAIIRAGGVINSGGLSSLNTSGSTQSQGLGLPSPRLVSVLRRTPNGGQVNIEVDLSRAQRDPRERILIQAKDIIMLQQEPQDAVAQYFSQVFRISGTYTLIQSSRAFLGASGSAP
jgi:hypothetical protein